jgi:hypothetical protein
LQIETRLATGQNIIAEISRHDDQVEQGDQVHVWWRPEDELPLPQNRL